MTEKPENRPARPAGLALAFLLAPALALGARAAPRKAAPETPPQTASGEQSAPWEVADAPLRLLLRVPDAPASPEAGALVIVHDGGRLPGPYALPNVRDGEGRPLACAVVWHNPAEGLGVVFAAPADGEARLYLTPSAYPPPRIPDSLRPGLLLYTKNVAAPSLAEAVRLASEQPPGRTGIMVRAERIGHLENPAGADTDYVSWYTGHFTAKARADAAFATVSDDGSSLLIDGRTALTWDGTHGRGGPRDPLHRCTVALAPGPHRIDYLHFQGQGNAEANALRDTGPHGAFETIRADALDISATALVVRTERHDGAPVADFTGHNTPHGYLWFGENPLLLFNLAADTANLPPDADFLWELPGGARRRGPRAAVTAVGETGIPVKLTVTAGGRSSCTLTLRAWSPPPQRRIEDRAESARWLDALRESLAGEPDGAEPAAAWAPEHWETLLALGDVHPESDVLREAATRSPKALRALPARLRHAVQDALIEDAHRRDDGPGVSALLDAFAEGETDAARRFALGEARVNALLRRTPDIPSARTAAAALKNLAKDEPRRRRTELLQGDVERMAGDIPAARAHYSAAIRPPSVEPPPRRPRKNAKEDEAPEDAAWRIALIRSATQPARLRTMLDAGAREEAARALREWEDEAPLDKLGGDMPYAEARLLELKGDAPAADRLLAAVTRRDPPARNTPELLALRIRLLRKTGREETAREVAARLVALYPGHPAAFGALPQNSPVSGKP